MAAVGWGCRRCCTRSRWPGQRRPGQHGYLIFENPGDPSNQQLADGPALGALLVATGVPVLVLNACRSAWTEASSAPGQPGDGAEEVSAWCPAW